MNPLVNGQKLTDAFGLMSGEIVGNDMNLAVSRLTRNNLPQKRYELFGCVPFGGAAVDLASLRFNAAYKERVP